MVGLKQHLFIIYFNKQFGLDTCTDVTMLVPLFWMENVILYKSELSILVISFPKRITHIGHSAWITVCQITS